MKLTLAKARKAAGFTQEQLAKKLNVTAQTLSKYENNPEEMKVAQAQRVAQVLGFSFDGIYFVPRGDVELNEVVSHPQDTTPFKAQRADHNA